MTEILAPCHLAATSVVGRALLFVPGHVPAKRFRAVPANSLARTGWVSAKGSRARALVLSDCLSQTGNPKPVQLSVMNSTLATETSLGRPS